MYNRDLSERLIELSKNWSVISVTGPRQSGKTTLCKATFPDYGYINLENSQQLSLISSDINGYLRQHDKLVIDEAQRLPELFNAIQVIVDEDKSRRYILSGSSDFLLMQNITQSLAGRVAILRLLPLSLSELGNIYNFSTDEIIYRGFYPAVWGDGRSPEMVYDSYLTTYVERDVRQIVNIKNLELFHKFLVLCAVRIGTEFNVESLMSDLGVSRQTIQEWMRILNTSYVVYGLQPFFRNIGKRLVKKPKIYFCDTGLACYLLGIQSPSQLATHPLRGNLFENMIVMEMLKSRFNKGQRSNLTYYRDKSQREVDVVLEYANKLRAYEIKSARSYTHDFCKNLDYFRQLNGNDVLSTQIIYDGEEELEKDENGIINYRHWKEEEI